MTRGCLGQGSNDVKHAATSLTGMVNVIRHWHALTLPWSVPVCHNLPMRGTNPLRRISLPVSKQTKRRGSQTVQPEILKGWQQIAAFLGEPPSVVQRWASDGMPVRKQGRYVETTPAEINAWLGKESGKPVHVATADSDLTAELKRGLSFVRKEAGKQPAKSKRK